MDEDHPAEQLQQMVVPGLDRRDRVRRVTARLRDLPGVDSVTVDPGAGLVVVRGPVAIEALSAVLADLERSSGVG